MRPAQGLPISVLKPARVLTVFLATLIAASGEPQRASSNPVLEPESGLAFPVELRPPGGSRIHRLAGTGIRTKTFLKVQVYALGLYLDPDAAAVSLAGWKGQTAKGLSKSEAFYTDLVAGDFGKSLRLVLTREVSGKDMAAALEDALEPRLERAIVRLGKRGRLEDLVRFREFFGLDRLSRDAEVVFSVLPGGRLVAAIDGRIRGEVDSPALCWALFDVYFGRKPVSKKARRTAVSGVPEMLWPGR